MVSSVARVSTVFGNYLEFKKSNNLQSRLYPTWTGLSALELDGKVHLFGGSKVVFTLLGVDGRTASVGTGWESPAPGG